MLVWATGNSLEKLIQKTSHCHFHFSSKVSTRNHIAQLKMINKTDSSPLPSGPIYPSVHLYFWVSQSPKIPSAWCWTDRPAGPSHRLLTPLSLCPHAPELSHMTSTFCCSHHSWDISILLNLILSPLQTHSGYIYANFQRWAHISTVFTPSIIRCNYFISICFMKVNFIISVQLQDTDWLRNSVSQWRQEGQIWS